MAKYIIDIPEKEMVYLNVWKCEDGKYVWTDSYIPSDLKPYTASESYIDGLKEGQNDAWEFASMLMNMHPDVAEDIYWSMNGGKGIGVAAEMTYQEAKARYDEWQKQKEKIHVGDEVIPLDTQYDTMIVTKIWTSEYCSEWVDTISSDGKVYSFLKTNITKTGRHFPEVAELLKKMREEE